MTNTSWNIGLEGRAWQWRRFSRSTQGVARLLWFLPLRAFSHGLSKRRLVVSL